MSMAGFSRWAELTAFLETLQLMKARDGTVKVAAVGTGEPGIPAVSQAGNSTCAAIGTGARQPGNASRPAQATQLAEAARGRVIRERRLHQIDKVVQGIDVSVLTGAASAACAAVAGIGSAVSTAGAYRAIAAVAANTAGSADAAGRARRPWPGYC